MPETVCVTVEQLREIEKAGVGSWQYEQSGCPACGAEFPDLEYYVRDENGDYLYDDDGERVELEEPIQPPMKHTPDCWLAAAIAQAERLKDWAPVEKDRVKLRAMPEIRGKIAKIFYKTAYIQVDGEPENWRLARYIAELLPEEGE